MTYRELLAQLNTMSDTQLDSDVTVYASEVGEFYPLVNDYPLVYSDGTDNDVLDDNHPYVVI